MNADCACRGASSHLSLTHSLSLFLSPSLPLSLLPTQSLSDSLTKSLSLSLSLSHPLTQAICLCLCLCLCLSLTHRRKGQGWKPGGLANQVLGLKAHPQAVDERADPSAGDWTAEREGNNFKGFEDVCPKMAQDTAIIRPCLFYVCRVRSAAERPGP